MEIKIHGGDVYSFKNKNLKDPIDFSANINPYGLPEGVKKKLKESIDAFTLYPDVSCNELKNALSIYEDISKESIVLGNGAADLIFRLVYAVKPKKALLLAPTFSEYELALSNVDCSVDYYYLQSDISFMVESDILDKIDDVDMVFICNPNNPTGMIIDRELMLKITRKCKEINCYLVIDECFNDFMENKDDFTCKGFINDFDNLVILKAFTKIFAMAGLRLGYLFSTNSHLRQQLLKAGQPWNVSVPAQIAGVEALKDIEYINRAVQHNVIERKYLVKALKRLGVKVFEGYANYILFQLEGDIKLYDELYNKGILIRKCENYIGLDSRYYRIAVKSSGDNKKLIKVLGEVLGGDEND